jgi:hypothetical protein
MITGITVLANNRFAARGMSKVPTQRASDHAPGSSVHSRAHARQFTMVSSLPRESRTV